MTSHIEIRGMRYSVEPDQATGTTRVTTRVDATTKLVSSVNLPEAAVPVIAAALGGDAAPAEAIDVGALRAEIRAAVVADLQAEHDAEITALRNRIAELEGQTQSAPVELAAAPDPEAEVVPISEAGKPAASRRKAPAKK